jgi:hypothetical protein
MPALSLTNSYFRIASSFPMLLGLADPLLGELSEVDYDVLNGLLSMDLIISGSNIDTSVAPLFLSDHLKIEPIGIDFKE